jgi:environmental stress-induced protein Ves
MHRLLTPADYRRMPWRNGGGETLEIATAPPAADIGSFAWRVSVADIAHDGPFSKFAGVDRTLVLLSGNGMRLSGAGGPLDLHVPFEPVVFAGEADLQCTLTDGPTRDFNLMVRRAAAAGEVVVVRDSGRALAPACAYVCYAALGACECLLAGFPPLELAPLHSLVVYADEPTSAVAMRVYPTSAQSVALVAVINGPAAGVLQ